MVGKDIRIARLVAGQISPAWNRRPRCMTTRSPDAPPPDLVAVVQRPFDTTPPTVTGVSRPGVNAGAPDWMSIASNVVCAARLNLCAIARAAPPRTQRACCRAGRLYRRRCRCHRADRRVRPRSSGSARTRQHCQAATAATPGHPRRDALMANCVVSASLHPPKSQVQLRYAVLLASFGSDRHGVARIGELALFPIVGPASSRALSAAKSALARPRGSRMSGIYVAPARQAASVSAASSGPRLRGGRRMRNIADRPHIGGHILADAAVAEASRPAPVCPLMRNGTTACRSCPRRSAQPPRPRQGSETAAPASQIRRHPRRTCRGSSCAGHG